MICIQLPSFLQAFGCFKCTRPFFRAEAGRGLVFFENPDGQIDLGEESFTRKLLIGSGVAFGSFFASSPHFFLNLLTVFSCSISLVSTCLVFYDEFYPYGLVLILPLSSAGFEHVAAFHGNRQSRRKLYDRGFDYQIVRFGCNCNFWIPSGPGK